MRTHTRVIIGIISVALGLLGLTDIKLLFGCFIGFGLGQVIIGVIEL